MRFPEIRVNFPWNDAFTNKQTTQTSIAYEKASVLFQIAATHSAIAASQNRSDPEGLKLAFYYFRTCAGMLTYINENFLHAPSTDLSREVIKFLVGVIMAQATEVFLEKCIDEKKAPTLVAKIASQSAFMYTSLSEEVKDFMGKGIFDRNWITLVQVCQSSRTRNLNIDMSCRSSPSTLAPLHNTIVVKSTTKLAPMAMPSYDILSLNL
jgi:hypothetical protein